MSKPPALSLAWWEGDGELAQRASLQQHGSTWGEGDAKVRVEGPSAFCSCNICVVSSAPGSHQHAPSPHSYYLSPEELHKLPKKIEYRVFFFKNFPIAGASSVGVFSFPCKKSFTLSSCTLCHPSLCFGGTGLVSNSLANAPRLFGL